MSRATIEGLLRKANKGVDEIHSQTGAFSYLFRDMLKARDIRESSFNRGVRRYIEEVRQINPVAAVSLKGNLRKMLAIDEMSFKNFLRALNILDANTTVLTLDVVYKDGSTTKHSVALTSAVADTERDS